MGIAKSHKRPINVMKGAKINLGYNQKTLQHETPSNVIQQI
jgi:hypothetical protein